MVRFNHSKVPGWVYHLPVVGLYFQLQYHCNFLLRKIEKKRFDSTCVCTILRGYLPVMNVLFLVGTIGRPRRRGIDIDIQHSICAASKGRERVCRGGTHWSWRWKWLPWSRPWSADKRLDSAHSTHQTMIHKSKRLSHTVTRPLVALKLNSYALLAELWKSCFARGSLSLSQDDVPRQKSLRLAAAANHPLNRSKNVQLFEHAAVNACDSNGPLRRPAELSTIKRLVNHQEPRSIDLYSPVWFMEHARVYG